MLPEREIRRRRLEGWQVGQIARYYQVPRLAVEQVCLSMGKPFLRACPHCGEYVPTVGDRVMCSKSRCRGAAGRALHASAA